MSMKTLPALLTLICVFIAPLRAQESRGTITGRVVDSTGAVVAGAEGLIDEGHGGQLRRRDDVG